MFVQLRVILLTLLLEFLSSLLKYTHANKQLETENMRPKTGVKVLEFTKNHSQ